MNFLKRLEETERSSSMSKEEAFVMKEMIGNKVSAARTARHERERRRRKRLVDQLSAQKQVCVVCGCGCGGSLSLSLSLSLSRHLSLS
jgi:fructoselysine-6-P-deglycase FrlB-like protein